MRGIMETKCDKLLLTHAPAHPQPWYVPDGRIRTQAAARYAAEVAQCVTARSGIDVEPDEHGLFVALHTSAYRAGRNAHGEAATTAEQSDWSRSWQIIRDHLVQRNLGLAYSMLRWRDPPNLDADERLSEALHGLSRAVERFNPWRGYRFSTYACNVIARAVLRQRRREAQYRQRFPLQYSPELVPCFINTTTMLQIEQGLDR